MARKAKLGVGDAVGRVVGGKAEGSIDINDGGKPLGRLRFELTEDRDLLVVWEHRKGAEEIRTFQAWSKEFDE